MNEFNRRGFITAGSASALVLATPGSFALAAECLSSYVPTRLTVDCASRHNFATFKNNPKTVGLAAVVSMTNVAGRWGRYSAGNLFLFPWLKPGASAARISALCPTSATGTRSASPLARASVADEFFCGYVLQAPRTQFIGFIVDVPYEAARTRTKRFSNVTLPGRTAVGVNWTSSNLNDPWFAGSRLIPSTSLCNGATWRKLIVDGLNQAAAGVC